ncbi:hypothetical protein K469DRAFT_565198 [Zopfia rhizophila CBS 207.26]|uniref:SnoaL-like domain-containing protein n=1 Tax=Zopfia rhizophila CBS 207.26 TaxID=1314779 RepID=A0A6A6EFJ0_9PEZI|nr:hypothetical protein K469DRAFT_565198 [Zopfia rhizophila CBS 207.26]
MPSPSLPPSSSPVYETLHATALEFIRSQDQDPTSASRINTDRLRAICSRNDFQHSWGHHYFTTTNPTLSNTHDVDGFIAHLNSMLPRLESWDTKISSIIIDEVEKMAVVRVSYFMLVRGANEPVENDLVWFLTMDEEGRKVIRSIEFIDAAASSKLREIMRVVKV